MLIAEAISKVKEYGAQQGIEGFLETLTEMEANYDELWDPERRAYHLVMRTGHAMFAPVDAEDE